MLLIRRSNRGSRLQSSQPQETGKTARKASGEAAGRATMGRNRTWLWATACLFAGALLVTATDRGQQAPAGPGDKSTIAPGVKSASDAASQQMQTQEAQSKKVSVDAPSTDRKKQLSDDSAQLLKLANELKKEVDKTDKDTLSLAVIRKADEIEKLAHTVREKMKLTIAAN